MQRWLRRVPIRQIIQPERAAGTAPAAAQDDVIAAHEDVEMTEEPDSPSPTVNEVDSMAWRFATLCNNNRGLNDTDRLELLTLLQNVATTARDHNVIPSITTLHAFSKFTDQKMLGSNDGWKLIQIEITAADVPELGERVVSLPFYHKDFTVFLRKEFGNAKYRGHFAMEFKLEMKNGYRSVMHC